MGAFLNWFLSLNIICVRLTYNIAGSSPVLLLQCGVLFYEYVTIYLSILLSIYLSICWWIQDNYERSCYKHSCTCLSMNNVCIWLGWGGTFPGRESLRCKGDILFSFSRYHQFSKWLNQFILPIELCLEYKLPTFLMLGIINIFNFSQCGISLWF